MIEVLLSDNDLLAEARAFNTIENCGINPQKAHGLIDVLINEVERLNAEVARLSGLNHVPRLSRQGDA